PIVLTTIIRRLIQTAVAVLVMSALVFCGLYMIGDPVSMLASPEASELEREAIRRNFGLDLPLRTQYGIFLSKAIQLDFRISYLNCDTAMLLILERMPATLELSTMTMLMSLLIGVPLSISAGLRTNSVGAKSVMAGSVLGFSLPNFWVG